MASFAKVNQLKQCPSCKCYTEKQSGCDYIDCKCGAYWCYGCTALYCTEKKKCIRCGMFHALINTNSGGIDEEWEKYKKMMIGANQGQKANL